MLSERERKVLDMIVNYSDCLESQLSDNYSNADIADLRKEFGKHETAGLLGSLYKKGFIWIEDAEETQDRYMNWRTGYTKSIQAIERDGNQIVYGSNEGWKAYFA